MHVSKQWKPGKKTVELTPAQRPSRIRRDPPAGAQSAAEGERKLHWWDSDGGEIGLALIGILLFALALDVIVLAISDYTSR